MRTGTFYLLALLLAAAPGPDGTVSAEEVVRLDAASQARIGIVVRPVLERAFGQQVRVLGEVVRSPGTTIPLKTAVQGQVTEILVSPGDGVETGQPLLRIHSHELHHLEGELLTAREARRLAEARYEAGRQLFEVEGIARIELERRQEETFAARIAETGARLELADIGYSESEIDRVFEHGTTHGELEVRAPATGIVLALHIRQHEWIQAFDSLLTIGDPRRVELELRVPPADADAVRRGDLVEFVPVGRPGESRRARVINRVPDIDPQTRMVLVRARIDGTAPMPGTYVQGMLTRGESRTSPSVPEAAMTRIGDTDYVFVRQTPNVFAARPVRVGHFNGSRYEILEGVVAGEDVVVEGVFLLKSALLQDGGEE